ncbi:MAG: glutamine--tRNA ligase/YqeY domain fusion protein [Chloroflexi bacterium]|nr:glutamine--tRNA ligase/YqeY domain fusion protein [Chloroflexota bacterium]
MSEEISSSNFITNIIDEHMANGRFNGRVQTRFPPEPNGYLHIGHAKSILLNYGIARAYNGKFNFRFDDTNPLKEEQEFIDAITDDVRWLGADWEDRLFYASDYFEQLYQWAIQLIKDGKAYVDDLTAEEIRQYRGTLTEPGKNSPYRDRPIAENLDLFERMKKGEFPDGSRVLRAKIDMASPNINFRDPVMYRILHAEHPRTGSEWCIYPMYDWAHGQSDSIEGITHSICTLEFEDHRPLYDWFIENLGIHAPQQIEFARLNLTYTVMSKRKLRRLVEEKYVDGWDDPRMPTIRGLRRRGYTPETLQKFAEMIGIAKANSTVEIEMLEHVLRDDLNQFAPRAMAVVRPLKLIITNYPENMVEEFEVPTHPQDKENSETRIVPFSREIYVEQEDYLDNPPSNFFRLGPGREVRLLGAYLVTCDSAEKDAAGNVTALHCTYDPASRGGNPSDGRRVKGTIHWVSAQHAVTAELRLYDRLFTDPFPENAAEGRDFTANLNPNSLETLTGCQLEPDLAAARVGDTFQFMRQGYFVVDSDSTPDNLVFNRTVGLRDTWAKVQKSS